MNTKNTKKATTPKTDGTAAVKKELPAKPVPSTPVTNLHAYERHEKAVQLHARIKATAELAATALLQFCTELKEMHDTGLYNEFGHDTFEGYTERELGIKKRQAYYYIGVLKDFGPEFLENNAGLGITRLRLLAEVAPLDRAEFMKENDLAGMSTAEIAAAVKSSKDLGEQLEMTTNQLEELRAEEREAKKELAASIPLTEVDKKVAEALEVHRQKLIEEAAKEAAQKAEAEAQKKFEAEKDKIKSDAVVAAAKAAEDAAIEKAKKDTERKVKAAKIEARREAEEEAKKAAAEIEQKLKAAEAKATELVKKLNLAASSESTAFAMYFEQMKDCYVKMTQQIEALKGKGQNEEAAKFVNALKTALGKLSEAL